MGNMSNLQKRMLQLSAPYKKSEAYKTFENVKTTPSHGSCFWKTQIEYVVKYENAALNK